jgi:hypothetical protein
MDKTKFLTAVSKAVEQLAITQEIVTGLSGVYAARGHAANGVDPITDDDLKNAGIPMTALQFKDNIVPLFVDYLSFCGNAAVSAKDRKSIMNQVRKDI